MIVSAHQPNILPGMSVMRKVEASDAIIWLDLVQYTKGGYTNRNRLPDGSWFTVPVVKATDGGPIRDVLISDHCDWRSRMVDQITRAYPDSVFAESVCVIIKRPWRRLVGLNACLLQLALHDVVVEQAWESHLAPRGDRGISEHLAILVAEVGGAVYLSGPSGRKYLDETPFHEREIEVRYFVHEGPNPSVLERYASVWPASISEAVGDIFLRVAGKPALHADEHVSPSADD